MSKYKTEMVQDITRRSIDNFINGQMHEDYDLLRRMIGEDDTPVVMLQHATLIIGFAASMFSFLGTVEDEFPEEILRGLLLAITEIAAQRFYAEKKAMKEEDT